MSRDYWPTGSWKKAITPGFVDMNEEKLMEMHTLISKNYRNIHGLMIIRQGKVVVESYYNGYREEDKFMVASVTKSIISALIGIAIDHGFIKTVAQKVVDFFPEYKGDPAEIKKQAITIENLLTMSAPYPYKSGKEPLARLCIQSDWVTYVLDQLGRGGEIGPFNYSTGGVHLLSAIITRSTGKTAREFANEYLFKPIGMAEIPDYPMEAFGIEELFGKKTRGWVKDPAGNSVGGWGLSLSLTDMAKLGFLYLNEGKWADKQIISKRWIEQSVVTHQKKTTIPNYCYGYLWWIQQENGVKTYSALGDGGNMICCIPEKDLLVAVASETMKKSRDIGLLLSKYILPTVNH